MVKTLDARQSDGGKALRSVAREFGVDPSQLRRWKAQAPKFEELLKRRPLTRVNASTATLHSGRKSSLLAVEEDLLQFIMENRNHGLAVSIRMVTTKASQLLANFRRKTARAKDHAIRRFVAAHGLVHRVHTHQSQESITQVREKAVDWIRQARQRLVGRDQRFIINMDQTPIFFSMLPRTTLETSGARSVNVRTSTGSTMRVTVAVTVTASGLMLPPFFVYKGKPGGRIEREFSNYNAGGFYSAQEKAWMDESIMQKWITQVLKPYVETAPDGVRPILFLDSYRCHLMASVVNVMEAMGVQVEHIPGGCTGLCQPIDVGIGKPLKNRVRNMWEDWMVEQGGETVRFTPPSRQAIAGWVLEATNDLSLDIIKNSWRHQPYSYFENENEENPNNEEQAVPGQLQANEEQPVPAQLQQANEDNVEQGQAQENVEVIQQVEQV